MYINIVNKILELKPENQYDIEFLIKINPIINFEVTDAWRTNQIDTFIVNELSSKVKLVKFNQGTGFADWVKEFKPRETIEVHSGLHYTYIKWKGTKSTVIDEIYKKMSYFFKPALNDYRYKQGKWDGMIRLYNKTSHRFPTGLLYIVTEYLERCKLRFVVCHHYKRRPDREFNWVANDKVIPEEDQVLAVNMAEKHLRGVIKAPTGFGKTAVLAVRTVANFGVPSLFLANKKTLLDDAKEAFVDLIDGLDETKVHQIKDGTFGTIKIKKDTAASDIPELDSHIIVATVQSLHSRLNDPRTGPQLRRWLQDKCKMFMVDECQAMGTKQWKEVLEACNAPCRFALSATPRRTDGGNLEIFAPTGDTIFFTTAEEQIVKGRLCELDIQYHTFDHGLYNEGDADIQYQEAYAEWIVNNVKRNEFLVNRAKELLAEDRLTLMLINFIDHGFALIDELVRQGIDRDDIRFVYGETKDVVRTQAIKEFRKGKFKVLIGSTIFDAGVNIPAISGVVIAGAGNSDITLIQKIGRGARNVDFEKELGYVPDFMVGHEKKITKVIDMYDTNVKFFSKQARNRFDNASTEFGESRVNVVGAMEKVAKTMRQSKMTSEQGDRAQLDLLNSFSIDGFAGSDINPNKDISTSREQNILLNMFRK